MPTNYSFGRQVRMERLRHPEDRGLLVVPLDHSVTSGPVSGKAGLDNLLGELVGNGVDAVVLHKGSLRYVDHRWFTETSLIVHLSASTVHAVDPDAKYLVGSVEESLRLGADAVSLHVNLGAVDEPRQIADLAAVADACDRWNMPLLAMVYPRGPKIVNPQDPAVVAHAVTLATDLGADIVKTTYAGSVAAMRAITSNCPAPVVVAGGPRMRSTNAVLSYVDEVLRAGAAGVAMGRNVFEAPNPGGMANLIARRLHSSSETTVPRSEDSFQVVAG